MAIQNSDDFIPQTVNASKNLKLHKKHLRCVSMLNFNEFYLFSFLWFHAPNYIKITGSYRHWNDVHTSTQKEFKKKGILYKKIENERFEKWSMENVQKDIRKS